MTPEDAADWVTAVVGKGIKSDTLKKYVGTLTTFFKKLGYGMTWKQAKDRETGITSCQGNPFCSDIVKETLQNGVEYKVKVLREKPRQ